MFTDAFFGMRHQRAWCDRSLIRQALKKKKLRELIWDIERVATWRERERETCHLAMVIPVHMARTAVDDMSGYTRKKERIYKRIHIRHVFCIPL